MGSDTHDNCVMCGCDVGGRPWVVLNRVCFGSGKAYAQVEFRNDDDEYVWSQEGFDGSDQNALSGKVACFPLCLQSFIEGRMLEAEIENDV